jgi:hypothetical protein
MASSGLYRRHDCYLLVEAVCVIRIPRPRPDDWDFGITYAKKHPPYVYSANGMGCLIHKIARVSIHWWEYRFDWLERLDKPRVIAETVCGMHKPIDYGRMRSKVCAIPRPDATFCGRCHGQVANFPRKDPKSKAARLEAKRKLGCIVNAL